MLAAVLVTFATGAGAALGSFVLPMLVLAAAGVLVALWRPEFVVVALLFGIALLPDRPFATAVGGFETDVVELAAFAVLGVAVVWAAVRPPETWPVFAGPALIIGAGIVIGAVVALADGVGTASVVGSIKAFLFYLLGPALVIVLAHDRKAWLERWVLRAGVAGASVIVAAAAVGRPPPGTRTHVVVTGELVSEAQRLRPPGLALMFLAALLIVHRMAVDGATPRRTLALGVLVGAQLLSFYRSSWVPMALVIFVYLAFRPGPRRPLRGLRTTLIVGVSSFVLFGLAAAGMLGQTAYALTIRVSSIGQTDVLEESSWEDRTGEWDDARTALRRSPIVGVGLGGSYGALRSVYDLDLRRRVYTERLYIHNSYLGAWLRLGLVGLAGMAAVGVVAWRRVVQLRRHPDPRVAGRALIVGLGLAGLAMQSFFQTTLTSRGAIITLAISLALLDRAGRDATEEEVAETEDQTRSMTDSMRSATASQL